MAISELDIKENTKLTNRRAFLLGGAMTLFSTALAYRMHFLQVKEASKFRMLADENRINIRLISPARGKIFDRNGILLAGNKQNFRVSLIKDEITPDNRFGWTCPMY